MGQTKTTIETLQNVTIFAGIRSKDLQCLLDDCEIAEYQPDELIIREGTPATEIYVIVKGAVKVMLSYDSEPLEIIKLGQGNCIGEASVIGIINHSASVVAMEPTTLLVVSRRALMHIFNTNKEVFSLLILNIARELARRLHRTDELLLNFFKKR
jgi:CRP-like cAMP-binding protein